MKKGIFNNHPFNITTAANFLNYYYIFFWCSTFVCSAWSFGFFIPATTANDLRLRRIFHPRFYPLHYFLNSWERASISLLLGAKQGNKNHEQQKYTWHESSQNLNQNLLVLLII